MAFTVKGTMRGRDPAGLGDPYELTWTEGARPLSGDEVVVNWLEGSVGQEFAATPVGPFRTLESLADPEQVMTALLGGTRIVSASGDVPVVVPALPEGAVG